MAELTADKRVYDLKLELAGDRCLIIPVQSPEAKGWIAKYADELADTHALQLVSRVRGMPSMRLLIPEGCKPQYFRIVRGVIGGGISQRVEMHCLGYIKPDGKRYIKGVDAMGQIMNVEGDPLVYVTAGDS